MKAAAAAGIGIRIRLNTAGIFTETAEPPHDVVADLAAAKALLRQRAGAPAARSGNI
jgi:hypothetical protein